MHALLDGDAESLKEADERAEAEVLFVLSGLKEATVEVDSEAESDAVDVVETDTDGDLDAFADRLPGALLPEDCRESDGLPETVTTPDALTDVIGDCELAVDIDWAAENVAIEAEGVTLEVPVIDLDSRAEFVADADRVGDDDGDADLSDVMVPIRSVAEPETKAVTLISADPDLEGVGDIIPEMLLAGERESDKDCDEDVETLFDCVGDEDFIGDAELRIEPECEMEARDEAVEDGEEVPPVLGDMECVTDTVFDECVDFVDDTEPEEQGEGEREGRAEPDVRADDESDSKPVCVTLALTEGMGEREARGDALTVGDADKLSVFVTMAENVELTETVTEVVGQFEADLDATGEMEAETEGVGDLEADEDLEETREAEDNALALPLLEDETVVDPDFEASGESDDTTVGVIVELTSGLRDEEIEALPDRKADVLPVSVNPALLVTREEAVGSIVRLAEFVASTERVCSAEGDVL